MWYEQEIACELIKAPQSVQQSYKTTGFVCQFSVLTLYIYHSRTLAFGFVITLVNTLHISVHLLQIPQLMTQSRAEEEHEIIISLSSLLISAFTRK